MDGGIVPVLFLGVLTLVVPGVVLITLGVRGRKRGERSAWWLLAAGAVPLVTFFVIVGTYEVTSNTVGFSYTVVLTPEGEGTVLVSFPAPIDEALIANLAVVSGSAVVSMNRSGSEPAIDVTLSGRAVLESSFSAYRYAARHDMTRADGFNECGGAECTANVSVRIISGNAVGVRVEARAVWSEPCYSPMWELDVLAVSGELEYPAAWRAAVC